MRAELPDQPLRIVARGYRALLLGPAVLLLTGCAVSPASEVTAAPPMPADSAALPVYFPSVEGYDRSCSPGRGCSFGPAWSDDVEQEYGRNGCDTRNDILRRDLTEVALKPNTRGCVVTSGVLTDPYSGEVVEYRKGDGSPVQIDHVFPLAAAWDRGAWSWTDGQRRNFANDPANLQTTTTSMNASKGDRLPGDWMPPVGRCEYALRVAAVAEKWRLGLTIRDVDALRECPEG